MHSTNRRRFLELAGLIAAGSIAGCARIGGSDDSMDGDTTTRMNDGMGSEGETMDDGTVTDETMGDGTTSDDGVMDDDTTTTDGMMDDATTSEGEAMDQGTTTAASMTDLGLSTEGLPELETGTYEGWAIFPDRKVSTETFSPGEGITLSVDRDLEAAQKFVVTIEPPDDSNPEPSGIVALAGAFDGNEASLSFPVSFEDATGSYILATPTDGGNSHETAGVWFLDPSGPVASLDLPELPAGWVYEGWAVTQGTPISTGRFEQPSGADGHSDYGGMGNGPPFPGEDLLRNAPMGVDFPADLADGNSKVVVSVEPDLGGTDPTGPKPFAIKPLVGSVPKGATGHTSYDLMPATGTTPTGTVTRQ